MSLNDVHEPVEHGRTAAFVRCSEVCGHAGAIAWVALLKSEGQLANRFDMAERLARQVVVPPDKTEPVLRSSEATPENVVEGVEVVAPV